MNSNFPLILLWGLKRSGNHAIINWLKPQARMLFFNNIIPIAPILLKKSPLPDPVPYDEWVRERTTLVQRLDNRLRGLTILASIEDHELTLSPFRVLPDDTTNIILLRDPGNFLASRIRKGFKIDHPAYPRVNGAGMQRVVNLWKSYARECLSESSHLKNKLVVYFPRWFADRDYRRSISRSLGLRYSDAGFGVVSRHGGGSSFDRTEFDGAATNMRVLDRTRQVEGEEKAVLDELLQDSELLEYSERVERCFGGRSGTS